MPESDKRRYKRLWRSQAKVTKLVLLSHPNYVLCKNISAGGLLLGSATPFAVGTQFEVEITLQGWRLFMEKLGKSVPETDNWRCRGRVVWVGHSSDSSYNLGVEFIFADDKDRELLNAFFMSCLGQPPNK